MYCSNCGNPVADNAAFCGKCGYRLKDDFNPEPTPNPAPTPNPTPAESTVQGVNTNVFINTNPAPAEPASWDACFLQRWKGFLSSPLVLSLLVCVSLVQLLGATTNPLSGVYELMDSLGIPYYYYGEALSGISSIMNSAKLVSMIPGILTAVSLWLVFFDARKGGPKLSTTGMTIIQVLQIISLVLVCLVFGIFLIAMMIAMGQMGDYYYYSDVKSMLGVVIVVVLLVGGASIFVYAKTLSLIKSAKTTMTTFVPTCDGAMFVGVMSIIGASFSALSVLGTLSYGFDVGLVLNVAVSFLYGFVAISYKGFVEKLMVEHDRMTRPYHL